MSSCPVCHLGCPSIVAKGSTSMLASIGPRMSPPEISAVQIDFPESDVVVVGFGHLEGHRPQGDRVTLLHFR